MSDRIPSPAVPLAVVVALILQASVHAQAAPETVAPETKAWLDEAVSLTEGSARDLLLHRAARAYARLGEADVAHRVATQIVPPEYRDATRVVVGQTQAEIGDIDGARETLRTIESRHRRAFVHEAMAVRRAADGDIAGAVAWVRRTVDTHRRASALARIAGIQVARGDPSGAARTAELIPRSANAARADAFTHIARAASTRGDGLASARAFENAVAAAVRLPVTGFKGGSPQAEALRRVALARLDARDVTNASKIVERISDPHYRATVWAELAQRHAIDDNAGASVMLDRAVAVARIVRDPTSRSMALRRISDAEATVKDFETAGQTTRTIANPAVRIAALADLATRHSEAGKRAEADALLREAVGLAQSFEDGDGRKADAFRRIVAGFIEMHEFETAREIVASLADPLREALRGRVLIAEMLTTILGGQVSDEVRRFPGPLADALAAAAINFAKAGNFEEAAKLAAGIQGGSWGEYQRRRALYSIAWTRGAVGDATAAVRWARAETHPEVRAWVLLGLVEGSLGFERPPFP